MAARQTGWKVEYTEPGVPWDDATVVDPYPRVEDAGELKVPLDANDHGIHHGVWKFRVSYWDAADGDDGARIGMPSAITEYHHGPPAAAPTGLTPYYAGPDVRRLVWDEMDALTYELRYTADPTDDEWTDWDEKASGTLVAKLAIGTEYTFELRALGKTRAGVGYLHGPSASITEMIPTPTPTLPEIALLLLAMLLLGSGVYLLRGRQSGGLTHT